MQMVDNVFSITGNKISAFITDENSQKFSSSSSHTVETFRESFAKKLSLAIKVAKKFDSIKSIKKEDNDKDILIEYKTSLGIPSDCEFSFNYQDDYDTFLAFFVTERYFTTSHET